jgi:hypothetical protein
MLLEQPDVASRHWTDATGDGASREEEEGSSREEEEGGSREEEEEEGSSREELQGPSLDCGRWQDVCTGRGATWS